MSMAKIKKTEISPAVKKLFAATGMAVLPAFKRKKGKTLVVCTITVRGQQGKSTVADIIAPLDASVSRITIESNNNVNDPTLPNPLAGGDAGAISTRIKMTKMIIKPDLVTIDVGNADARDFTNGALNDPMLTAMIDIFVIPVISSKGMMDTLETAQLLLNKGVKPNQIKILVNQSIQDNRDDSTDHLRQFSKLQEVAKTLSVDMSLEVHIPRNVPAIAEMNDAPFYTNLLEMYRRDLRVPKMVFDSADTSYYNNEWFKALSEGKDTATDLEKYAQAAGLCRVAYHGMQGVRNYVFS